MNLEKVKDITTTIIRYVSDQLSDDSIVEETISLIIQLCCKDLYNLSDDSVVQMAKLLYHAFDVIRKISSITSAIWGSDGTKQQKTTSSLGMLLYNTLNDNYHSIVSQCQNFDITSQKCKLGNPLIEGTDKHTFICDFHKYDTVSMHLVLASIHNGVWICLNLPNDDNDFMRKLVNNMLLGLFHDIGKPLCVDSYEYRGKLYTGFPAHAEIGCMLFQMHYSNEMENYITKADYMNISYAILRHMCGLTLSSRKTEDDHKYKYDLLLLESKPVKNLLLTNMVGDCYGKLQDYHHSIHDAKNRINEATDIMLNNDTFDLKKMLENESYNTIQGGINPNKVIIYMIGTSGSGKTYFVNELIRQFGNTVSHVSRDECISEVCVGIPCRLEGRAYSLMYDIHNAYAEAFKVSKKSKKILQNALQKLDNAQRLWNNYVTSNDNDIPDEIKMKTIPSIFECDIDTVISKSISEKVNELYVSKIVDHYKNSKVRMIVLDTCMNSFPVENERILPDVLKKCFRIHIHIQSYVERTTSSLGVSINEQLKITGPYGLSCPLHPRGFGKFKKLFTSLSAEEILGTLPKSTFDSKFRPHLVYVCVRTETGTHGYDECFESLHNLVSCYVVKSDPQITEARSEAEDHADIEGTDIEGTDIEESVFGIDPKTKDMNVVEFYTHLLNSFKNDRPQIIEYLRILGFVHNSFFASRDGMNGTKNPTKNPMDEINYERLATISEQWHKSGIVSKAVSIDELKSNPKILSSYAHSVVILRYFDLWGARYWQNRWAKECRGVALFVNPETNRVKLLSYKLPRGAEMVTGMVKNEGLETQDVKNNRIDIFDDEQKDTCTRLLGRQPLKCHLLSKADGSLFVMNIYTGEALEIMKPILETSGYAFSMMVGKMSLDLTNGKRLMIPSTQNTLIDNGFMAPYNVTAILMGGLGLTIDQFNPNSLTESWEKHGYEWLKKFNSMKFFDELTETHTVSFETICKNRTGLFGDPQHAELACSYDRYRCVFLGISIVDKRFYLPYSVYTQLAKIEFEEPLWWDIEDSKQIEKMIDNIDKILLGELSKEEYLTLYPPSNISSHNVNSNNIDNIIIDYEGWIVMKCSTFEITDSDHVQTINYLTNNNPGVNITTMIYSKVKTGSYYKSHAFHAYNIEYLFKIAEKAGNVFPLAKKVYDFLKDGELTRRLREFGVCVNEILDIQNPNNKYIEKIRKAYQDNLASSRILYDQGKIKKLPLDPLTGYEKRPNYVNCQMIMNYDNTVINDFIPAFIRFFPELNANNPNVPQMVKGIIMTFRPWDPAYNDTIQKLDPHNAALKLLIDACL